MLNKENNIDLEFFSNFYEKSLNKTFKKLLGQFYTPQNIVIRMVQTLEINKDTNIIDPACGAGIFVTKIIDKYAKKVSDMELVEFIKNNMYANDIHPFAIIMTKINILIKIINTVEDKKVIGAFLKPKQILKNIKLKDTLEENNDTKYDIIIGNPPFFKMDNSQLETYMQYQEKTYGQPNIYELFMYWSFENIKEEGIIQFVVPQSFKAGLYFKTLRQELSKKYIETIISIENTKNVFCEVEQPVLIIYIKNIEPKNKNTQIIYLDAIEDKIINNYKVKNNKIYNKTDKSYEIYIAKQKEEYDLIQRINKNENLKTLKELGYKFANGLFVWNQNKKIIGEQNTEHTIPIVYSDYLETYKFDFNGNIKNNEKGLFCSEGEIANRFKLSGEKLVIQRTSTFTKKKRLTACIISNKFAKQYPYYLIENHVNFLSKIDSKTEQIPKKLLYFYLAIINSDLTNWIFKIKSGNTQISATELNLLPICPYNEKISELSKKCCTKKYTKELEEELNNQIYISYGITNEEIQIIRKGGNLE